MRFVQGDTERGRDKGGGDMDTSDEFIKKRDMCLGL
jgi:hypothetical protein